MSDQNITPIKPETLREGTQILVRGKTSYVHLATMFESKELEERAISARMRGQKYSPDKPYRTIEIVNPQIIPTDSSATQPEETYVKYRFYTGKSGRNAGKTVYSINDFSPFAPPVYEPVPQGAHNPTGASHRKVESDTDLIAGLDVTLVLRVYKPKGYENRGISVSAVICNEPARFYKSGAINDSVLNSLGITISDESTQGVQVDIEDVDVQDNEIIASPPAQAAPETINVAPATSAQVPATVQTEVSPDDAERIAQLQAEIAALKAQKDAVPAQTPAPQTPPNDAPAQASSPFGPGATPGIVVP